jgi:hypothetical protein
LCPSLFPSHFEGGQPIFFFHYKDGPPNDEKWMLEKINKVKHPKFELGGFKENRNPCAV